MKFSIFLSFFTINLCLSLTVKAQENNVKIISEKLHNMGFENIRGISKSNNDVCFSLENNIYRWEADAIITALDTIAIYSEPGTTISIYMLKNDVPRLHIKIKADLWIEYRLGDIQNAKWLDSLTVDYSIEEDWENLKNVTGSNPNINKIDLVLYPQLTIQNRLLTQLYEIQLNIAPAFEISLWRGMLFTGQIIFPVKNDLEVMDIKENEDYEERDFLYTSLEGDYIRPGFITISQDIRFSNRWFCNLTLGNFNTHRYGIYGQAIHYFKENKWRISFDVGLTGSSHFFEKQWVNGRINTITWHIAGGYFISQFNLQCDLSYGSYLNNDKGIRVDCNRHFGSKVIGLYAMQTGGSVNGGFKFTIPFPTAKRNRKHNFRVTMPKFFDSDYNARYAVYYGKGFETRPNENQSEHFLNPVFIKNYFVK